MNATNATDPALAPLLEALRAIAEAATNGLASPTAEDALDVVLAIESAARTASLEFYGIDPDDDPAWDAVVGLPADDGEYDVYADPNEVPL